MKIVFFGDSVTEGCFEIVKINGQWECLRDPSSCFATLLSEKFEKEYPNVECVNSGRAEDGTAEAIIRNKEKVLDKNPDVVVFGFLLNDAGRRDVSRYEKNLRILFDEYKANGIKVVYLTPNMYNTYVSPNTPDYLVQMAYDCADCENSGEFAKHVERGKEIAKEYGFYVADVYSEWKKLQSYGINTTALLANQINHPTRKMHKLYADVIFKCLIDNNLI